MAIGCLVGGKFKPCITLPKFTGQCCRDKDLRCIFEYLTLSWKLWLKFLPFI
jgi:hypothetical protein